METEEWFDDLWSKVKDIVDSIKKCLGRRAECSPSVIRDFSFVSDVVAKLMTKQVKIRNFLTIRKISKQKRSTSS